MGDATVPIGYRSRSRSISTSIFIPKPQALCLLRILYPRKILHPKKILYPKTVLHPKSISFNARSSNIA